MKHIERLNLATLLFFLTLLLSLFFAPALSAQILLEENFDAASVGDPPSGWSFSGFGEVREFQSCPGNAFRMNQYFGETINILNTPDLSRGTTPGNIAVSFDLRLANWNDNSTLTGAGGAYAQLFVNGSLVEDFVSIAPVSYTPNCETQTASFSTADIPLGSSFRIRFLGVWGSGDWSYVVDNIDIRVVNDECASAALLPQTDRRAGIFTGDAVDGSFEGATQSQPGCTGNANDDVWYKFVATERSVSITVEAGDVVVELFSGTCGSLNSLECLDENGVNELGDYHGVNIGETYYIRVYSFAGTPLTGTDADFRIQIGTPASVNNECVSAEIITQSAATSCGTNFILGTLENATESQTACVGTANNDVWYQFEATSTDFSVYLESGDFVVQLFEGNCGSLTSLVCRDLFTADEYFNYASATIGNTYFLRVYSFGNTALTGTAAEFGICVFTSPPTPANDNCSGAISLSVSNDLTCAGATSATTNGASRTETNPLCSGINGIETTWFSFTALGTEHIITMSNVNILNGDYNDISTFEVFSGSCGALVREYCSEELLGSDPSPITVSGLTIDETYLLRVVPCSPRNTIDFDICITSPCLDLATGLSVTDITATTATLNRDVDNQERYLILMSPSNVQVYGANTSSSSILVTGLTSNTTYEYFVGQDCPSTRVGPFSFTTRPSCGDVIYDTGGPTGNYNSDEDNTVTICPETADPTGGQRQVSITFDEFDTESDYDGVTIYDGEDTNAPVITSPKQETDLWSWDKALNRGSGNLEGVTVFTLNASGCITLRFTSDHSIVKPGFKATINCDESADIVNTILTAVPSSTGAVTADRAYLSTGSDFMYYVKEGTGSLLALKLGDTQAQVPISGVTIVAGSGATNLGLNGCMAPYANQDDWWIMNRTWDVAPTVFPTSPVEVRTFYTQADFNALAAQFSGLTHENLTHYKINSGDEEDLTVAGNACHDLVRPDNYEEFDPGDYTYTNQVHASLGTTAHQASFFVNSFSGGGGGAGTNFSGALPVELVSFTGQVMPKNNQLKWTTAREENTDFHSVERSTDGQVWVTIGQLAAAGNSATEMTYDFTDETPETLSYYRIVTVDIDDQTAVSDIVELQRTEDSEGLRMGNALPSPTTGPFSIDLAPAKGQTSVDLRVIDASGRQILHQRPSLTEGWNRVSLDLTDLPAGVYWLRATDAAGRTAVRPVVKR